MHAPLGCAQTHTANAVLTPTLCLPCVSNPQTRSHLTIHRICVVTQKQHHVVVKSEQRAIKIAMFADSCLEEKYYTHPENPAERLVGVFLNCGLSFQIFASGC